MSAPVLDSTLPRTPAHEWANETTDALSSNDKLVGEFKPPTMFDSKPSAVSTPGNDLPGAYPKTSEHETAPDPLPSTEQIKGAGVTVIETAKAYLPAQQDVDKMIEVAKGYLPQAVQGYFPATTTEPTTATTSLPSQEVHGDTSGKSDGVGSLPGNVDEPAVAKLPEERSAEEKKPLGSEHPIVTTTNTIGQTPSNPSHASHSLKDTALSAHPVTAKDDKIIDNIPREDGGSPVHTLPPAPIREFSSVADEGHSQEKSIAPYVAGSRPNEPPTVTNPIAEKPSPAPTPDLSPLLNEAPKVQPEPRVTTSIPLEGSTDRPSTSTPVEKHDEPLSATTATSGLTDTKSTLSESDSTKKHKTGFMDKIKGEVKILSGKMSHDEKKIEEGKRLMGKV